MNSTSTLPLRTLRAFEHVKERREALNGRLPQEYKNHSEALAELRAKILIAKRMIEAVEPELAGKPARAISSHARLESDGGHLPASLPELDRKGLEKALETLSKREEALSAFEGELYSMSRQIAHEVPELPSLETIGAKHGVGGLVGGGAAAILSIGAPQQNSPFMIAGGIILGAISFVAAVFAVNRARLSKANSIISELEKAEDALLDFSGKLHSACSSKLDELIIRLKEIAPGEAGALAETELRFASGLRALKTGTSD